jgi:hypothetical protein
MQALWIAVLSLAIDDALNRSSFNAVDYRRDGDPRPAAWRWFEQGGPDFETVAALAGIDDADGLRHAVLNTPDQIGELNLGMGRSKRRTSRTEKAA